LTSDALNVSAASPNIDVTDTGTSHASQDFLTNSNAARATIGVERSSGGGLFVGSSPYAAVFGTASAGNTEFATNNNVRMTISSSGSVGIGTSSPSSFSSFGNNLVVGGGSNNEGMTVYSSAVGSFYFADGTTGDSLYKGIVQYEHATDSLNFYANYVSGDSPNMRIDSSGNVIIGDTSNNGRKFRVKGSGDLVELVSTNAGAGGAQLDLKHESASAANGDLVGIINFSGLDSGGINTQYASIQGVASDISAEKGELRLGVRESASTYNADAVVIDSSGRLGLKTSANASFNQVAGADLFVLGSGAGDQGMTIYSGNSGTGNIMFADGTTTTNQYEGYVQYVHSDNRLLFGSNHATRMTVENNGDVTIEDGNLVIGTSGHGIDFSATANGSGTTSSEVLDDYEEGTFTVTLPNGGGISSANGTYIKIGNKVTATMYVTSINPTADTSQFRLGGLPFTARNTSNLYVGGSFGYVGQNDLSDLMPITGVNLDYVYFHENDGPAASVSNNTMRTKGLTGDSADAMILTITYFT